MAAAPITPGQRIGRWTVLEDFRKTPKGERKWHCRCTCGAERYVAERSLKNGSSQSCGCLRREEAARVNAHQLAGKVFGDLTVLERSADQRENGGIWWRCRCACGAEKDYPATLLATGRRTNCGGKAHEKNYFTVDIQGSRYGRLTALYPLDHSDASGSRLWHCRCDCGTELDLSYNTLVYSPQVSCGCQKKEHDQRLQSYLTHVDGTSLDILQSKKIPVNNTTGHKGVYFIRGRYVAKVVFQKKAYYLGTYDDLEKAAKARREAEELLFESTLDFHARYQQKAAQDPQWAAENPMQIQVDRKEKGLKISFLPKLA